VPKTKKADRWSVKSKATTDDFVQSMRDGNDDDIRMARIEMSSIVRKRENVMTAEKYCAMMRTLNVEQLGLVLDFIKRIYDNGGCKPLQIFTGPAGCGKTHTLRALMETTIGSVRSIPSTTRTLPARPLAWLQRR